ncbi:MAG: hypothetical protein ACREVA_01670 [Burkholderiales bacterium]
MLVKFYALTNLFDLDQSLEPSLEDQAIDWNPDRPAQSVTSPPDSTLHSAKHLLRVGIEIIQLRYVDSLCQETVGYGCQRITISSVANSFQGNRERRWLFIVR